jgi:rhamnose utilization protein RhaD (predicted bifunctional aldolase and dehydrogenase)
MRSRWNDAEVAALEGVDLLVYASRLIGAESSLVVWGGGNTSVKVVERDHRGREVSVLRVKGSGSDLKSIQRKDFPGVRMDDIRLLLERQDMGDEEMVAYLAHALQEPGGPRPSIETLLHGFVDTYAVVHTHADAIVSLTNNDRAADVLAGVYGKEVLALDYRRPGFGISREVADAIAADPQARALLLAKHGTITWGATVREAYEATIELISRAEDAIAERRRGRPAFGGPRVPVLEPVERRERALDLLPRLRGSLSRERRVIVRYDDSLAVTEFVSSEDAPAASQVGPATPDHTIYTKRLPCFVDLAGASDPAVTWTAVESAVERFVRDYTAYVDSHRGAGVELLDALPRVVLVPGLGLFTAGRDARTAGIVKDIYHHTISVIGQATAFGRYVSLTARDAFDVEYWPLELYKLTLAPPEKELARRIVLVTGGGSGIGRAVAQRLAAEGAHVAITDVDAESARRVADEVTKAVGGGRHQRGVGPGGVRGDRARLGRPRHPRLQCRHRAFRSGGPHGAGRLGALVRGELHRPLPGGPRGHAGADPPGHRRLAGVRRHQERDVAGQGLRRVLGGQGGRGPAGQGAGARGRPARHPLQHREPRRRVPGLQALVGGDPA